MVNPLLQKARDVLSRPSGQGGNDMRADDTAPGIKLLKQVWKIDKEKPVREQPPSNIIHDIYNMPGAKKDVPPRASGRAGR